MSRAVPLMAIHKAVLNGIVDAAKAANDRFGMWLTDFPEYYVTARVADRLAKTLGDRGWVHLEQLRSQVLKSANADRRGRPSRVVPPRARFDLTAYYLDECPRVVIEIKSPVFAWNPGVQRDLDRICDALKRDRGLSSLQCGIIGLYTDAAVAGQKDKTATERIRRCLDEWEEKVDRYVGMKGLRVDFVRSKVSREWHGDSGEYEAWAAWVAMVRPR